MTAPPKPKKVCLVAPGHLSSTPRMVKEADALAEAGYEVVVVSSRNFPPVDALDQSILSSAHWTSVRVDACAALRTLPYKVARKAAQHYLRLSSRPPVSVAALAEDAVTPRIAAAAAAQKADLYIGHCLGGLYAAAHAARRTGSPFGFDIEDYHDGETVGAMDSPALAAAARVIQQALLRKARYLTAASPLIGAKYREVYAVDPKVILNVFPRSEAPPAPVAAPAPTEANPAALYWFSQTTGPGRGIEEMLGVAAHMKTPVELHLRGFASDSYRRALETLSRALGLRHPPRFLDPAAPSEMSLLCAPAHAGLCVELANVPNHDLCLANKIFTYLLGGIPVLLSSTQAHTELAPKLGAAALLLDLADPVASAARIDALFSVPGALDDARSAAWRQAQERYCWDREKQTLLSLVGACFP